MTLGKLAVKKALKQGMDEVEAVINKDKIIRVEFAHEIQSIRTTFNTRIGLRVVKGKKVASYTSTILSENEVGSIVDKTIKIVKATPDDPHWNSLNNKTGKTSISKLYDPYVKKLDYDEITASINEGISTVNELGKALVVRGSLTIQDSSFAITSSNIGAFERKGTSFSTYLMAKAKKGGESTGIEHLETRFWKEIDYSSLAKSASDMSQKYLDAKPIESAKIPVIIKNDIFAQILNRMLSTTVSAETIQKGRSPLKGRIDEQIADVKINCFDDGTLESGYLSKEFDDEGHPTQRTAIISDGILKNYLYDSYTAKKDNVNSTGNARRAMTMKPSPRVNNLILQPGKTKHEEAINETKKGLLIEDTIGEWLSNPISGQLNATITHGYLIENGELTKAVKNVILSGNFWEALKNNIEAICDDSRNIGNIYSPTVKFSELTIAGK